MNSSLKHGKCHADLSKQFIVIATTHLSHDNFYRVWVEQTLTALVLPETFVKLLWRKAGEIPKGNNVNWCLENLAYLIEAFLIFHPHFHDLGDWYICLFTAVQCSILIQGFKNPKVFGRIASFDLWLLFHIFCFCFSYDNDTWEIIAFRRPCKWTSCWRLAFPRTLKGLT